MYIPGHMVGQITMRNVMNACRKSKLITIECESGFIGP